MGRLRVLSGDRICRILEEPGYVVVRQRGSHRVMQMRMAGIRRTVPVPLHDTIRRGTLMSIIRQSGLPREISEAPM